MVDVVYLKMLEEILMVCLRCHHLLTFGFEILGSQISKEIDWYRRLYNWLGRSPDLGHFTSSFSEVI